MYSNPDDPADVLRKLNDTINDYFDVSFFVTVFYAVIDPVDGTIVYSSAGHLPALLVTQGGKMIPACRAPAPRLERDIRVPTRPAGPWLLRRRDAALH